VGTLKIVFIPNLPYTYRDHERFGVKYFIDKGYDVEVLDIHKILIPGYKEKVKIDYWTFDLHIEVENKCDLLNKIKSLKANDFIFFYIAGGDANILLHEMRKVTKAKFITYMGGSIPDSTEPCGIVNNMKLFMYMLIRKIMIKKVFSTDYYVSGSKKDEIIFSDLIGKKTKVIQSHSRDYNLCLSTKGYKHDAPYCVFLDTDVINASDYELFDIKAEKNIENYLKKLIIFFKWIEENFRVDVIIAAHPKSRIYLHKDNIDGIKIVHSQSSALVKNSEFVINEGTTAVSYAIFFKKPLFFFTLSEISFFQHTCSFAKALDKNIINIDRVTFSTYKEIVNELKNYQSYEKYKKNYLTYADNKISTFDLINDIFKNYKVVENGT